MRTGSVVSHPTLLHHVWPLGVGEVQQSFSDFTLQVKTPAMLSLGLPRLPPRLKHQYPTAAANSLVPLYIDWLPLFNSFVSLLPSSHSQVNDLNESFCFLLSLWLCQANKISPQPLTSNEGGKVLTLPPNIGLCFWGKAWPQHLPPTRSQGTVRTKSSCLYFSSDQTSFCVSDCHPGVSGFLITSDKMRGWIRTHQASHWPVAIWMLGSS